MDDDAVIIEGVDSPEACASLYSSVHGAGRLFGRKEAKRRFTREEMHRWLTERGVMLIGADLDESPMAYRRLPESHRPACRHREGAAHAAAVCRRDGGRGRVRSVQGLGRTAGIDLRSSLWFRSSG
jgi:RNA-splicing ligase RtcB